MSWNEGSLSNFVTCCWLAMVAAMLPFSTIQAAEEKPQRPLAELRDGDRIVFLGGTFIERMQHNGYLEGILTVAHPEKRLTFRNLGWSGDTVWGESRGVFGSAEEGFKRLVKDVTEAKPTLIVICYGANEAYAGPAGAEKFTAGMNRLLDALKPTAARFVLLSPVPREKLPAPLPDPSKYNNDLWLYRDAIAAVAAQRNSPFVDLMDFGRLTRGEPTPTAGQSQLTTDGVAYSDLGYWHTARWIARRLGASIPVPQTFTPLPTQASSYFSRNEMQQQFDAMRQVIHAKNVLYFHRYRPQNETHLFLFRKHEQGNNAVEIPQFDPLIEEKERTIATLRKPEQFEFQWRPVN